MRKRFVSLSALLMLLFNGCAMGDIDLRAPATAKIPGAIVQNGIVAHGDVQDTLLFSGVDGHPIVPGTWRIDADTKIRVDAGQHAINFSVTRRVGGESSFGDGRLEMFEAKEGHTYVLDSEDAPGQRVRVWIDDAVSDEKASDAVLVDLYVPAR